MQFQRNANVTSLGKTQDTAWDLPDTAPLGGAAKRSFDIGFSLIAILSLLPIYYLIAVAIRLSGPGPIFFLDTRVGFSGKTFRCIKFRTMYLDADERLKRILDTDPEAAREYASPHKLKKDPRIIPVIGHILRMFSLDELPQFANVLMGDMSVVGPRPITEKELDRYGPSVNTYLATRPGVTGLWQVSGRSDTSYPERIALDGEYVRSWSFKRDLRIIFATIVVVVGRKGAY